MKHQQYLIVVFLFILFLASSCKPKADPCEHDFDQTAMLTHIGTKLIVPSYEDLQVRVDAMKVAAEAFTATPNSTNLSTLRTAWKDAWKSWQWCSIYEFGPAAEQDLRATVNNFPVNTTQLNTGIDAGTYDLSSVTYSYANGFPALDYLLYGVASTKAAVVAMYDTDTKAANRKQYLKDVVNQIDSKVNTVTTAWQAAGGNYVNTFSSTTGVAAGDPLNLLVNQLNANYELAKNNKIGTPVGAKISYVIQPNKVEAYYSRISLELAVEVTTASRDLFLGYENGVNGLGLDDYLAAAKAMKNGQPLEKIIEDQYNLVITELNKLKPSSLHDALTSDLEQVKAAYAAAQNQVLYTKTDMASVLCTSITYVDDVADGD
ncbi:MAG: imelysin family protein [Aureispira sp.]|nr:imelysin family protein [Aureispira sp.]